MPVVVCVHDLVSSEATVSTYYVLYLCIVSQYNMVRGDLIYALLASGSISS